MDEEAVSAIRTWGWGCIFRAPATGTTAFVNRETGVLLMPVREVLTAVRRRSGAGSPENFGIYRVASSSCASRMGIYFWVCGVSKICQYFHVSMPLDRMK